ncbi:MAG: hypothetical protein IT514_15935, partial [Burkholderiales bacterium]|nr:hypothetical protein [Burkholderiales bacterium]
NASGTQDNNEPGIANVTLTLLDENGNLLPATVTTDAEGNYLFGNLKPGVYGVRETQPDGYYDGLDTAGSAGGVAQNPGDQITGATLTAGRDGKNYDFGELPGGVISGHVFRDGPPIALDFGQSASGFDVEPVRPGVRSPDDTPLAGVTLILADGQGNALRDANGNLITAVTNAAGFYQFTGLTPGSYSVLEQQPGGLTDGVDTPGNTGGIAANKGNLFSPVLINLNHRNDAIVGINVQAGTESVENNFSEVAFSQPPLLIPPPENRLPPLPEQVPGGAFPIRYSSPAAPFQPGPPLSYSHYYGGGADGVPGYSWHLSVIDAGSPRGNHRGNGEVLPVSEQRFDAFQAMGAEMGQSRFVLPVKGQAEPHVIIFGMQGATPIAGD